MELGSVQQWSVSGVQAHPLHVHVNPMQIQSLTQPTGRGAGGVAGRAAGGAECDDEYGFFCVGDWVDTLQIPSAVGTAGAVVRYRVSDFTGDQVIHCHYLVHEDQGCLTFARIVNEKKNETGFGQS
jgi:FtsP/CotA-like multicopper oxidase with cupredoxin domain